MNVFDRIKRMRALTAVLTMVVLNAACSNPADIAFDEELPTASAELQGHLKWDRPQALKDITATLGTADGEFELVTGEAMFDGNSTSAEGYTVSFWAIKGEQRSVQLTLDGTPVVTLDLPALALRTRSDGSPIAYGDSVYMTMKLDATDLKTRLLPDGLRFSSWHQPDLTMSYDVANADFNADGVVNKNDTYIEQNLLGIWSQSTEQQSWTPVMTEQSFGFSSLSGPLSETSGYAVSW